MVVASRLAIRLCWGLRRLYLEDYFIIMAWVRDEFSHKLTKISYLALNIVLSVGLSYGLAASSRGNWSFDDKTEVLKVPSPAMSDHERGRRSSFMAISCI